MGVLDLKIYLSINLAVEYVELCYIMIIESKNARVGVKMRDNNLSFERDEEKQDLEV